jgi:alpha-ketoglutarate-dependent taurine dioxygenase
MERHWNRIEGGPFGTRVECGQFGSCPLPLVIRPTAERYRDLQFLLEWSRRHAAQIERAMASWGAVLLRGFAIRDTAEFEQVCELFPAFEMGYEGGATARAPIGTSSRVFEATRVPPTVWIMLHQEMAYLRRYPAKLAFFCRVPAQSGGETILGDMRRFTAALPPRLVAELADKGVRYRRNFRGPDSEDGRSDPVFNHRSWVDAFYTDDRGQVEAECRARGLDFEWLADGSITTWNTLPGLARHGLDGDTLYFNQLHSQTPHPRWMGDAWARYREVYCKGVARPYDACFGDGTPLPDEEMNAIYDALAEVTLAFPWQSGDVLLVDNLHTAHGRNPFTGQRDVQVALLD